MAVTGIVLDTNVISEPRQARPDPRVSRWFRAQDPDRLYLTATVVGELSYGIARMSRGRRRSRLEARLRNLVKEDFAGRILPYDADAALAYGELMAGARSAGRMPPIADAQIAAVARAHGFAVATRDVDHLEPLGVDLLSPWEHE